MSWWCSATGQSWDWSWQAYPGVWLFVLTIALVYWRTARIGLPDERRRALWLGGGGLLLTWVMLDWPVGPLGAGYLVSVHAAQFLVLAFIVPPMLLSGVPAQRWAQLETWRRRLVPLRVITHPLVTAVVFNLLVLTTHVPSMADRLMARQLGAFLVDLAWLGGGLLFWWPIVAPAPLQAAGPLGKIAYLFAGSLIHTALGVWLLLSGFPVYGVYELAPPIAGRSAMVDQAIAGGVMELVGALIIIIAIAVLFFRWAGSESPPRPVPGPIPPAR